MAAENLSPWGAILGVAGDIFGAVTTWYAAGEQRKENAKVLAQQDSWFQQNYGLEQEKMAIGADLSSRSLAETSRQARTSERLTERQMRTASRASRKAGKLAERGMVVSEAESAAGIALGQSADVRAGERQTADIGFQERDIALAEKTAKFDQIATVMGNMTRFLNTPGNGQQFVSLWRK